MTIIATFPKFHIEVHRVPVFLGIAAGVYESADVALDKPGRLLAFSTSPGFPDGNDSDRHIGEVGTTWNSGAEDFNYGQHVFNYRIVAAKTLSTLGSTMSVVTMVWVLD